MPHPVYMRALHSIDLKRIISATDIKLTAAMISINTGIDAVRLVCRNPKVRDISVLHDVVSCQV